jgi:hypothetical protein
VPETVTLDQAVESLLSPHEAEIETEDTNQDVEVETEEIEDDEVTAESDAEDDTDEEDDNSSDETDETTEEDDGNEAQQRITVKVDGKEVDVTLDDLKRSYSGQGKIQKGMQDAAEMRKQAEVVYHNLQAEQQRFLQNVQALQQEGLKSPPKAPDYAMLETDPIGYMQDKAAYDNDMSIYQAQQGEIRRMQQQQSAMQQQAQSQYLQEQAKLVQDIVPEFKNPELAQKFKETLVKTGMESYGFTGDEMNSIMDARAVAVLSDAYRWRSLQTSKASAKKAPNAPRNVKPTARRPQPQNVVRNKQLTKARSSGKLEDFASLLFE